MIEEMQKKMPGGGGLPPMPPGGFPKGLPGLPGGFPGLGPKGPGLPGFPFGGKKK
jgi:signal recognition particle subunit SRP54